MLHLHSVCRYKVPGWGGKGFVVPSEVVVTTVSAVSPES
jgi:hypothetical protein